MACVGTVRFNGKTHFAEGEWIGVELDEAYGKNNGEVADKKGTLVRYFECKDKHGLFVRPGKLVLLPPSWSSNSLTASAPTAKASAPESSAIKESQRRPRICRGSSWEDVGTIVEGASQLQAKFAVAVEQRDITTIEELLPRAKQAGLQGAQLQLAQKILDFESNDRSSAKVRSLELRVTALEQMVEHRLKFFEQSFERQLPNLVGDAIARGKIPSSPAAADSNPVLGVHHGKQPIGGAEADAPTKEGADAPAEVNKDAAGTDADGDLAMELPLGDPELEAAATKIQAVHRGKVARKELVPASGGAPAKEEADAVADVDIAKELPLGDPELEVAATKIQAVHRGKLARKEMEGASGGAEAEVPQVIIAAVESQPSAATVGKQQADQSKLSVGGSTGAFSKANPQDALPPAPEDAPAPAPEDASAATPAPEEAAS